MVQQAQDPVLHRHSCNECQRRKQKCNREWPCDNCKKRRVIDRCRFKDVVAPNAASSADGAAPALPEPRASLVPAPLAGQKRALPTEGGDGDEEGSPNTEYDEDADGDGTGLAALGYMDGRLLESLGEKIISRGKSVRPEDYAQPDESDVMQRTLDALSNRRNIDTLVQKFFANANYHYYILFSHIFLGEYQEWWRQRDGGEPLSIQWTALLLTVCAMAVQHLEINEKPAIEAAWGGESADSLTERLFHMGTELAASVPVGNFHIVDIQRMLHAIYWYKSEARFGEAWLVIGEAVRKCQELHVPQDANSSRLSDFDREVRRRTWGLLSTWDWQFASGLGRPTLIDHKKEELPLPALNIENLDPSPLLYMKLQAEIISKLGDKYGAPCYLEALDTTLEYIKMLEDWVDAFPAVYRTEDPDHSRDEHPWVVPHRFYIHTMAYLMILNPIRKYMGKLFWELPRTPDLLKLRDIAVHYSLKNLQTTSAWIQHISHRDGRFHFIIFSLFDTAAVLSAAIHKDLQYELPQRNKVITAIDESVDFLDGLNQVSGTAGQSFALLSNIVKRVPGSKLAMGGRKRQRLMEPPITPESDTAQVTNGAATTPAAPADDVHKPDSGTPTPTGHGSETASPHHAPSNPTATSRKSGSGSGSGTGSGSGSSASTTGANSPVSHITTPDTDHQPAAHEHQQHQQYQQNQQVQSQSQSVMPPGQVPVQVSHNGYPMLDPGFVSELKPSFPPLDLDPEPPAPHMAQATQGPMDAYTNPPVAGDEYDYPPITEVELGAFNSLWDWAPLNLPFIQAVKPTPPE